MNEYAEGSGSTWEDLEGDPRIVVGAEVLLGVRAARTSDGLRSRVGLRATVMRIDDPLAGCRCVSGGEMSPYRFCVRDLVCLRLASGELTEEGRALEALDDDADAPDLSIDSCAWLIRAGIWYQVAAGTYRLDRRRLAMALGREDVAGVDWGTNPPTVAVAQRPAAPPPPPAPVMCARCGVQPRRYLVRMNGLAGSDLFCGDCFVKWIEGCDGEAPTSAPSDLSGEHHLSELRDWLRRPMGTR